LRAAIDILNYYCHSQGMPDIMDYFQLIKVIFATYNNNFNRVNMIEETMSAALKWCVVVV
jgi:hypothetical protein